MPGILAPELNVRQGTSAGSTPPAGIDRDIGAGDMEHLESYR